MKLRKTLAVALAGAMCMGTLAACGGGSSAKPAETQAAAESEAAESGAEGETEAAGGSGDETPMVVGYSNFNSKFSPFFAETAYDQDVSNMTQLALFTSDRQGAVVEKGIEGTTIEYNGTDYTYYGPADLEIVENEDGSLDYNITLRDDLKFSDGEPMTIDDVIFSMYVVCDPTYDGSATLFSMPIEGMAEYRSGVDTLANLIVAAGEDNTDFTNFTEEQQKAFWDAVNDGGVKFAQEIVDYCVANGLAADAEDVKTAAGNWGFELEDGATAKDFFLAIGNNYGWSFSQMEAETAGSALSDLIPEDVYNYSTTGVTVGETAPNITGIVKTGDYSMTVKATEMDANMIYQLAMNIAPMHYYGDAAQYDYDNNMFGFPKGDLSLIRSKTTQPMGAGMYKFIKFENGVVNFEANENFYKGTPKTKYINFREVSDTDKLNGVVTGTIDITDPSFSKDTAQAIANENGGEITGDKITTDTVDNLGYGYIGINSHNVCVGDEPGSDASKNLRKAFATIFSVYRDVAVDSYYGEAASVINYPISNTSWAAPQPTDDGYQLAFSVDVDGNPIYTSDMDADAKYAAAKAAALGFFEAAGYTVADGKVTAAPEGAKMEYEILIPADGTGDHPSFMILTLAKEAFAELGINLIVTDLANSSELWTGLEAQQVDMWCAAWGATPDPDMYQVYYSGKFSDREPGGSAYMYQIEDEDLDSMILEARTSADQEYRKAVYKACLDTIIDWACEIPVYQRQNAIIFSTERVNMDTVTPDITTYYGWMMELENTELK